MTRDEFICWLGQHAPGEYPTKLVKLATALIHMQWLMDTDLYGDRKSVV